MAYVLNFQEVDKNSLPKVGGKNASLGELIKADIRVPPGFAVTTDSYQDFITQTGISEKIFQTLSAIKPGDISALNAASENIQQLIKGSTLSKEIRRAVDTAYTRLCDDCGVPAMPVAVRSSATAEDLPTASFAGQQDTYLWIQGV
jgi:pyruvate,water dikinase